MTYSHDLKLCLKTCQIHVSEGTENLAAPFASVFSLLKKKHRANGPPSGRGLSNAIMAHVDTSGHLPWWEEAETLEKGMHKNIRRA